jgi:hypothetical protein
MVEKLFFFDFFPLQPFGSKFQANDFIFFNQVHPMNMYLHRGAVLQKCTKVAETIV